MKEAPKKEALQIPAHLFSEKTTEGIMINGIVHLFRMPKPGDNFNACGSTFTCINRKPADGEMTSDETIETVIVGVLSKMDNSMPKDVAYRLLNAKAGFLESCEEEKQKVLSQYVFEPDLAEQ